MKRLLGQGDVGAGSPQHAQARAAARQAPHPESRTSCFCASRLTTPMVFTPGASES